MPLTPSRQFLLWDGQLYLTGEEAMTLWDEIVAHPACRTFDELALWEDGRMEGLRCHSNSP